MSLIHKDGSTAIVAEYTWDYDATGQLIEQSDHGRTVNYTYDDQGQLTDEVDGVADLEYAYDANGNRDGTEDVVDAGNQLSTDGVWVYSYDDEGNIAQKERISDGVTWHYGWDHRNQLTWAEERDDGNDLLMRVEYRYDAWGNRIEKNVDWNADEVWDTTQRYVLDGWNPVKPNPVGNENWDVLLDLDDSNALETRYLRGDVVDELFGRVEEGAGYWTLLDHQGSVRDVLGESGSWLASVQYDAFGNVVARFDGGGDPLPESDYGYLGRYGWTGRERDAETGLQYNRARYYDPRTGRWFSMDPLGFAAGDANLYRYVGNQVTGATDPSGYRTYVIPAIWTNRWTIGLETAVRAATSPYKVKSMPWGSAGVVSTLLGQIPLPSKLMIENAQIDIAKNIIQDIMKHPLAAGEPLIIVGHSTGEYIALDVADKVGKARIAKEKKGVDHLVLLGALPSYQGKEVLYIHDQLVYASEKPSAVDNPTVKQIQDSLKKYKLGVFTINIYETVRVELLAQGLIKTGDKVSYKDFPEHWKLRVRNAIDTRLKNRWGYDAVVKSTIFRMPKQEYPVSPVVKAIHNFRSTNDPLSGVLPDSVKNGKEVIVDTPKWMKGLPLTGGGINPDKDNPHNWMPWMPDVWNYIAGLK